VTTIPFSALRVRVCQPDGAWLWLPVSQSPYYLSLTQPAGRQIFEQYHEILRTHSPKSYPNEIDWDGFMELAGSIQRGFDLNLEPRVWIEDHGLERFQAPNGYVRDGQHRLSCLLHHTPEVADYRVCLNGHEQLVGILTPAVEHGLEIGAGNPHAGSLQDAIAGYPHGADWDERQSAMAAINDHLTECPHCGAWPRLSLQIDADDDECVVTWDRCSEDCPRAAAVDYYGDLTALAVDFPNDRHQPTAQTIPPQSRGENDAPKF